MRHWKWTNVILAAVAAIAMLSTGIVLAKKPDKPPGGGGGDGDGASQPTGVIYYNYNYDNFKMSADGTNKTALGMTLPDTEPSIETHNGGRWFLHATINGLGATKEDGTSVDLVVKSELDEWDVVPAFRWLNHPVAGADAMVSWREYRSVDGEFESVLIRAPVVFDDTTEDIVGLNLASAEYFDGISPYYDWSPDGTAVAFREETTLWIYDTLTDEFELLPATIHDRSDVRWSPDGTKVVYGVDGPDTSGIETINLSDYSCVLIASGRNRGSGGVFVYQPFWSPDGQYVIYNRVKTRGYDWDYNVMRCTVDGKSHTNLTRDVDMTFPPGDLYIRGWRAN
jgi:hypothetical protein